MAVEVGDIGLAGKRAGITIHTVTVALFVATAVIGFAPRSASILSGTMPMPPLAVHVHAFLMTAWIGLLAVQTGLVAAGKRQLHRTLGLASFVLAPALLAGLIAVTILLGTVFKRFMSYKEKQLALTADRTAEKAAQYASHVEQLEARVRVLERIATDKGADLAQQIEDLRTEPVPTARLRAEAK